ncbi:hypothetical protein SAMN05660380_01700 [Xylella fastidiosa]|jgi:hypothetical protein|nr:hypothetical protein SAMN05660380_01700 [Xylella fastidiosa]
MLYRVRALLTFYLTFSLNSRGYAEMIERFYMGRPSFLAF